MIRPETRESPVALHLSPNLERSQIGISGRMPGSATANGVSAHEVVRSGCSQGGGERIQVEQVVRPHGLPVRADPELLERVIVNLVGNSTKFTPRGAKTAVEGRKDGDDDVLLSVRGNRPSVPLENQARIFDQFTHAGQRRQQGSSPRLTFCKLGMEAHREGIHLGAERDGERQHFPSQATGRLKLMT